MKQAMTWSVSATILLMLSQVWGFAGDQLHEEVLFTQVRIRAVDAGGSGTVIYAEKDKDDYQSIYILTCHHVVQGAIEVKDQWDSVLKKQRKMETVQPVIVEFFQWDTVPHGKAPLTSGTTAKIKAYSAKQDLALIHLRLRDDIHVAKMLRPEDFDRVHIGTPTWAAGCALLHTPIMTHGIVSSIGDVANSVEFDMSTAQIIFGNSGGGMFAQLKDGYYFIGVPSLVDVVGWGSAVTHCGYYSPVRRIYEEFFKPQMYEFLIPGSNKTEAECEQDRKERREREERKLYK